MIKSKTKSFAIPGIARATSTIYNSNNYSKKGVMAGVIYGKGNRQIKQSKATVTELPGRTITKITKYGPVDYYGKQKKSVTRTVTKR